MIFWFEKHNKISWIITILIAIVIFYLSSLSFEITQEKGVGFETTIYHFYAFFFLSLFLLISLIKGNKINLNVILIAMILSIVYAISDEIHQLFVPGRTFTIFDILTDSAGILLAGYLYLKIILGKKE
jgi:VanZ family protein